MSTLERLFRYAKASRAEALENFLTEALAAAIRDEPAPFFAALAAVGVDRAGESVVATQEGVGSAGVLDLLLRFDVGAPVVVEVKAWSPPYAAQLEKYAAWCASEGGTVVLLAPTTCAGARHLPWQRVFDSARDSSHVYWRDLCLFLKGLGMAQDMKDELSEADAVVLRAGPVLLKKAMVALMPALRRVADAWPAAAAPSQAEFDRRVLARWRDGQGMTFEHRASVELGLVLGFQSGGEEPVARVWIWRKPGDGRAGWLERASKLQQAAWTVSQDPGEWEFIAAEVGTAGAAVTWLTSWFAERLEELRAAGLLGALATAGAPGTAPAA